MSSTARTLRAALPVAIAVSFWACARGGMPQVTADPATDPVRWRMLQNPSLPKGARIPQGPSVIRVSNPVRDTVLVVFTSGGRAGWFFVDRGEMQGYSVANGTYQMFFVYAEEPQALYQGDDVSVFQQISTIQLVAVPGGNYGIRRVR